MPWSVNQDNCVVNDDTGETVACHESRESAEAQVAALYANYDQKRVYFGGSVKALDNGVVEGYLIKFTSDERKDVQGEYFDTKTDLHLKDFPIKGERAFYHHGLDDTLGVRVIGRIAKAKIDDAGVWVEAQLDMRDDYEKMIYELAKSGKLGWSSGALPTSVKVADDGHIDSWAVIEGSLTPTPAMPLDTKIYTVKALAEMHKGASMLKGASGGKQPTNRDVETTKTTSTRGNTKMDNEEMAVEEDKAAGAIAALSAKMDEVLELLGQRMDGISEDEKSAAKEATKEELAEMENESDVTKAIAKFEKSIPALVEKSAKAVLARREKTRSAVNAAFDKVAAAQPGTSKTAGLKLGSGHVSVSEPLKYVNLSASDMALGVMMKANQLQALGLKPTMGQLMSDDYLKTFIHKASAFAESQPFKSDLKGNAALKAALPIKANELDASDIATQGAEWVAEYWATEVWRRARFERIYDKLVAKGMMVKEIGKGFDVAHFPTEGSDPTVYTAPQANDVDATNRPEVTAKITPFTTGVVDVTPKELKLATAVTVILDEDAIVDIVGQVNYQINEKMLETRDQLAINGDTATGASTNINLIDGTPATGLTTPYYIASDGFRKLPLVTNTAASRSAGGSLAISDYRATLAKLSAELRQYRDRMVFIIDPDTETASLALPEIASDDVRRTSATITAGVLQNIYGIDVFTSGFLPLSNTAGKINGTSPTTNNIYGSILLLYAPYWGFAYKRQITIETGRDILSGTNVWVASVRMGLVARGTNAAAITYGVGVAS